MLPRLSPEGRKLRQQQIVISEALLIPVSDEQPTDHHGRRVARQVNHYREAVNTVTLSVASCDRPQKRTVHGEILKRGRWSRRRTRSARVQR